MIISGKPIPAPFPYIPRHIIKAISVRQIRSYGSGTRIPVTGMIFIREFPLPNIAAVLSARF
jgi:tetrahydromethanopterin S-methyltransferase subunit C